MIPVSNKPQDRGAMFGGAGLGPLGALFCVLFCAAAAFILDYGVLPPPFAAATISPIDYAARRPFRYSDPDETKRILQDVEQRAAHVFIEDSDWVEGIMRDLERIAAIVEKATSPGQARDLAAVEKLQEHSLLVDEMYRNKATGGLSRLIESMRDTLRLQFTRNAILSEDDFRTELNRPAPRTPPGEPFRERRIVRVKLTDGRETTSALVEARNYLNVNDALDAVKKTVWRDAPNFNLSEAIARYLYTKFKPALTFDSERSRQLVNAEIKQVGDKDVQVREGDLILQRNQSIGAPSLLKLRRELVAFKTSQTLMQQLARFAALMSLAAAMLVIFLIVVARLQPTLWERRRALVMLALSVLGTLAACRALVLNGYSLACTPLIVLGMTAALAFGQVVALLTLLGTVVLAIFATISWEFVPLYGGTPFIGLALLAGAIAAAIPTDRLNTRLDLLKFGLVGGLLQGSLAAAMSLFGSTPDPLVPQWPPNGVPTLTDAVILYANGPFYGLVVLGAQPLIEWLFGILTNIRLYELADFNQPALRRIQLEAPGTFAHTLQVRFLAEPAADAIGANTRLVSAGVLYHDLGKTLKPEYYVENAFEAEERHRRLKPSVSALLIISHVKDGVDLAREYGMPQQIIDFIPEHHGTTLVSYFYHSAKKDAEKDADSASDAPVAVDEAFFRYPGPKPRSRETAIVMLADTVEAATRTLNNPSNTRLKEFVHDRIMDKLLDNQLDECSLTFAELALVEEAFLRVLTTRFHSRIRYPGQDEEDDEQPPPRPDDKREDKDDLLDEGTSADEKK